MGRKKIKRTHETLSSKTIKMEHYNDQDRAYLQAKKYVRKIRGFYTHAAVYVLVNLFLIGSKAFKYSSWEDFWQHNQFWGFGLWGIGLIIHGLSVFVPNFFLGRDWEEKKIQEILEKNKK